MCCWTVARETGLMGDVWTCLTVCSPLINAALLFHLVSDQCAPPHPTDTHAVLQACSVSVLPVSPSLCPLLINSSMLSSLSGPGGLGRDGPLLSLVLSVPLTQTRMHQPDPHASLSLRVLRPPAAVCLSRRARSSCWTLHAAVLWYTCTRG